MNLRLVLFIIPFSERNRVIRSSKMLQTLSVCSSQIGIIRAPMLHIRVCFFLYRASNAKERQN